MVKVPPLAVPQLGSCASSGRAWRLWAARRSQKEAGPLGTQPLPERLEPAASKAADFTAALTIQARGPFRAGAHLAEARLHALCRGGVPPHAAPTRELSVHTAIAKGLFPGKAYLTESLFVIFFVLRF